MATPARLVLRYVIRQMKLCSAGAIAFLIVSMSSTGWADTVQDWQTWTKITATGRLTFLHPGLDNFRYWLEGQARFGNDTSTLTQGLVRPGLGYAVNDKASLWLGYAYFPTDPFTSEAYNEQRLWEQFLWAQPTDFGKFSFRNRLEQRFRPAGSEVGWRFRQMYALSYPLSFAPGFSLEVSDEVFVNLNNTDWTVNGFDQNRAFVGISYHFNQPVATEIGYMNRYIRETEAPNKMEHILSLSLSLHY